MADLFDARLCALGEGPLWHPERQQLFWFDIEAGLFLSRDDKGPLAWSFDECVSACGWVDLDRFLIASETALFLLDIKTGGKEHICSLEADNPVTRSNDGRADPYGGFWIGTMGKQAEEGAGAIYRFYKGALKRLYANISISNAICFTPDGRYAYFTDTRTQMVMRVRLDDQGWPAEEPALFIDFCDDNLDPDGAIVDQNCNLWIAQWGASRIAVYGPDGGFLFAESFDAPHMTCPAIGGAEGKTLFATSARCALDDQGLKAHPKAGAVFQRTISFQGQREHRVLI